MRTLLFGLVVLALAACTQAQDFRQPAAGETRVDGRVIEVEDGGYPQFTVTVQPEGDGAQLLLYLNAEAEGLDLGGTQPAEFRDGPATVYYVTEDELNLLDLRLDGQTLTEATGEPLAGGDSITGVLSGADAVTGGDLPDLITVTDAGGQARSFEYYITDAIVAANGRQVTAYYSAGQRKRITLMRARAN